MPAQTEKKQKPIREFRQGAIKGAVWEREHEGRTFYNVSISRSFKVEPEDANDDGWRESSSFDLADLETVKLICDMAAKFIKQKMMDAV